MNPPLIIAAVVVTGLVSWRDLSASRLSPFLNTLTGDAVYPEFEK